MERQSGRKDELRGRGQGEESSDDKRARKGREEEEEVRGWGTNLAAYFTDGQRC